MGYSFDLKSGAPDDFDVDIYELSSLKELTETFVDEGLFGDIPERLLPYLDYDALARDLGMDYSEIAIAGTRLIYMVNPQFGVHPQQVLFLIVGFTHLSDQIQRENPVFMGCPG